MMAEAEQVAALPWRMYDGRLQVLLVTTRETRRWVIPKGWPMPGKTPWEAAAIEAFEEAGVNGTVSELPCGSFKYRKRSSRKVETMINVSVYALETAGESKRWPEMSERKRKWFSPAEAASRVGEAALKQIIAEFAAAQGVTKAEPRSNWLGWLRRLFG